MEYHSIGTHCVTPQTQGSVDYPSTRGILVDVGLPDATPENRAESPLYGKLYPNTKPTYTCPKQCNISNISNISNHMSNTDTWAHKRYSYYILTMNPTIYQIVTRVTIFSLLYNTYIKIKHFNTCIYHQPSHNPAFF